jgi:hypothetical protein
VNLVFISKIHSIWKKKTRGIERFPEWPEVGSQGCSSPNEDNGASWIGEIVVGGFDPYLLAGVEEVFSALKACINGAEPLFPFCQLREFDEL